MYLIRCSQGHEFPVPTKAAGSTVSCPTCGSPENVPKLGDLRQMPRVAEEGSGGRREGLNMGAKIVFALLLIVTTGAALTAVFAAFRWSNIPVTMTQEEHIAAEDEGIAGLNPLQLIQASEQIEQIRVDEQMPYQYHSVGVIRNRWKTICFTTSGIAGGSLLIAGAVLVFGRGRRANQPAK